VAGHRVDRHDLLVAALPDTPPGDATPLLSAAWPLVLRWGESDDVERQSLIEASSEDDLRDLLEAGRPLLPAINDYLDATGDAPHAVPYGDLAQAIMQAEIELRDRS
jgi:hypothetical protein